MEHTRTNSQFSNKNMNRSLRKRGRCHDPAATASLFTDPGTLLKVLRFSPEPKDHHGSWRKLLSGQPSLSTWNKKCRACYTIDIGLLPCLTSTSYWLYLLLFCYFRNFSISRTFTFFHNDLCLSHPYLKVDLLSAPGDCRLPLISPWLN